jgi:Zn-dependent protease with chaperone function
MNIKITSKFKKEAQKAILSIICFILFYFLLLILAIGLAVGCFFLGLFIIQLKFSFITLLLGIGVIGIGIIVVFFLIKFIFKINKTDLSEFTEIKRNHHPKLFNLIDEIVKETGTKFPKHVYISTQVNASVFYNSSFLSLFFPVRKNLHIGLGLVNSVTYDELKAIIGHEFGHFSQKSMKVGSYVYQVNHIIFNLLYDNDSFNKLVEKWMNISSYFSIFVIAAYKIIEGVQWLLQKMYVFVNKSYLGLSREMEFHADAVAANIAGSEAVKTSLMRMELTDLSFSNVLDIYNERFKDSLVSENIFKDHKYILLFLAKNNKIPIENSFPQVSLFDQNKISKSKLVIEDQWASHPNTSDRIDAVEKLHIQKSNLNFSEAINLFSDTIDFQKRITKFFFEKIPYEKETQFLSDNEFFAEVEKKYKIFSYNDLYNDYYDYYSLSDLNLELLDVSNLDINELFSNEKINVLIENQTLESDIATLEAIRNNYISTQSVDYEGVKYNIKNIPMLILDLNQELKKIKDLVQLNDRLIYSFFYNLAKSKNKTFDYEIVIKNYLKAVSNHQKNMEIIQNAYNDLHFVNMKTPFETISSNFENFEENELLLKNFLIEIKNESWFENSTNNFERENIYKFINSKLIYFENEKYNDDSLNILFNSMNLMTELNRKYFLYKKQEMLEFQITLL